MTLNSGVLTMGRIVQVSTWSKTSAEKSRRKKCPERDYPSKRYQTPLGFCGPIGMLAGLAGFGIFRQLGLQTEDQLVSENNRSILMGNQLSSIPYLALLMSYCTFVGSMVTITLYASYGSAVAGGLTGGLMASKLNRHREQFYASVEQLIN